MVETPVWSLVREDPTCSGASKSMLCKYWSLWALERMLRHEKAARHDWRVAAIAAPRESPHAEDPAQPNRETNDEVDFKKQQGHKQYSPHPRLPVHTLQSLSLLV